MTECRFGAGCTRPDCWFLHPQTSAVDLITRQIDSSQTQGVCKFFQGEYGLIDVPGISQSVYFSASDVNGEPPFAGCVVLFHLSTVRPGQMAALRLCPRPDLSSPVALAAAKRDKLVKAAAGRLQRLREWARELTCGCEEPGYVCHPKHFLVTNVFAERHQIPEYRTHQSGRSYSSIFVTKISIPWLVDANCQCGTGNGKATAVWVGADATSKTDIETLTYLWDELFGSEASTTEGPRRGRQNCFCHVAYGYGVAASRKEAEQMAALDACTKLHSTGLLKDLHIQGQSKIARDQGLEADRLAASSESDWFRRDPKGTILNFANQNAFTLEFINDTEIQSRQSGFTVTGLLTLADGSQIHRRASRKSRKEAEKAVSLELCEDPGIMRRLRPSFMKRAKRTREDPRHTHDSATAAHSTAYRMPERKVHALARQMLWHASTHCYPEPTAQKQLSTSATNSVSIDNEFQNQSITILSPRPANILAYAKHPPFEAVGSTVSPSTLSQLTPPDQHRLGAASFVSSSPATVEWFSHNPKLYLLRYTQQYSVQLGWDRAEIGPTIDRDFCTRLTVPLPAEALYGADKREIVEQACCRTKKLADHTVALAACRQLVAFGLLQEPALAKQERRSKKIGRHCSSLVATTAAPCSPEAATLVRLRSDAPLLMMTPHLKGLLPCSEKHLLANPVTVCTPPNFLNDTQLLKSFVWPSGSCKKSTQQVHTATDHYHYRFSVAYHNDPSLSPNVDQTKWDKLDPDTAASPPTGPLGTARARLPIFAACNQIVQSIRSSEVVIVHGAPGVGKSTQLSQYIMSDWVAVGIGSLCSVVHCVPDSFTAVAMSDRVAEESFSSTANVGVHTMLVHRIPMLGANGGPRTIFTTTGELLRRLVHDPFLSDATHVIIDEVDGGGHVDVLLTILKILVYGVRRKSLRLVVVTAEECCRAHMTKYFEAAAVVDVERQSLGPVCTHYLEDILQFAEWMPRHETAMSKGAVMTRLDDEATVELSLITSIIAHIATTTVDGGILIFLPAADLVTSLCATLRRTFPYSDTKRFCVAALHDSVPAEELQLVFCTVCVRKIIVATSIAERQITVADVRYVIDSGRTQDHTNEEIEFCCTKQCERRALCAGQCQNGQYYCLLSASRVADLTSVELSKIMKVPLDEVVLAIQLMGLGGIKQFFSLTPAPPPALAVKDAVRRLHAMRALGRSDELTPLGRMMAQIPFLPVNLRKFVLLSALFNLREDALTIAAALGGKSVLVLPAEPEELTKAADAHRSFGGKSFSDHQAMLTAYNTWRSIRSSQGDAAATQFCMAHYLSENNLIQLSNVRSALDVALASTGVREIANFGTADATGDMDPLLRAALTASLQPNVLCIAAEPGEERTFCSRDNCCMLMHPNSVNFGSPTADLPNFTVASPLALLVLNQGSKWQRVETPAGPEVQIDDWPRFVCPQLGTYDWLCHLRRCLDGALMQAFDVSHTKDEINQNAEQTLGIFYHACVWMDDVGHKITKPKSSG